MSGTAKKSKSGKMLSSEPQTSFWLAGEEDYERRYGCETSYSIPGANFWLADDMHYDMDKCKGRGHFAIVWRAKERESKRVLAVKRFICDSINIKREVRDESKILDVVRSGVSMTLIT
jgi:hypothetical protein